MGTPRRGDHKDRPATLNLVTPLEAFLSVQPRYRPWPIVTYNLFLKSMRYALLFLLCIGLLAGCTTAPSVDVQTAPGLHKSETVIQAEIARKQTKLDGTAGSRDDGGDAWRRMMRVGRNGEQPGFGAILRAKAELDQRRAFGKQDGMQDGGIGGWTWLGPGNIGGRLRSILIHPTNPDIMYLGTAGGGIWATLNGGTGWFPLNDFLPSLFVTGLAMDPTNYDIMYAATGEGLGSATSNDGAGVFKSTNAGLTWTQLPATNNSNFEALNEIAHDPSANGILYVATKNRGIWRSLNAGTDWTRVYNTTNRCTDIKIHPNLTNRVVMACNGVLRYSTDYGEDSIDITPPDAPDRRFEVAWGTDILSDYLYAVTSEEDDPWNIRLWRSTTWGSSWALVNDNIEVHDKQVYHNNTIWVDPEDPNHLVLGGIDLWRSTNGGFTLTKISNWPAYSTSNPGFSPHADHHVVIHHPDYDGSTNTTVFVGNDGGIQKTDDITTVTQHTGWTNLANNLGLSLFYRGAASPDGSVIVGGTHDNSHLHYTSVGGQQGWFQTFTGDGSYSAVSHSNTDVIYGETQYGRIKKSTDGGASYTNKYLPDTGDKSRCAFNTPFIMSPTNASVLVAGCTRIFRTTNGASSWPVIREPVDHDGTAANDSAKTTALTMLSTGYVWAGYAGGHLAWTNNAGVGATWTRVDENGVGLPDRTVTDIAIDPDNPARVFVTFSGYENDTVWYTEDLGQTWEPRHGTAPDDLPDIQINGITMHPYNTDWIYVATDLGVMASNDSGLTWSIDPLHPAQGEEGHEGPNNVEVSDLFWHEDFLVAATFGRGMFRTRPSVIFVDGNNPLPGNGLLSNPYQTINQALGVANPGSTIYIFSDIYDNAPLTITDQIYIKTSGAVVVE